jgi:hypothetical protein
LRAHGSNEYKAGYLPFSIVDGWQQLRKDFAYWRVDVLGEQSGLATDADRQWLARDRNLHEMLIVRDLGYWSHFVADGSQPMHASIHYDGWGDYPNPNGYTTQKGLHAYFEGEFVRRYLREEDVKAEIRPYRDCKCSIQDRTVSYLLATQSQVIPLYELQKRSAFDGANQEGKEFAAQRIAAAVSELRDMVIDAWHSSTDATVGYPPVRVRDIESGAVVPIQELKGLD